MDADEQVREIQDAFKHRIYAGLLPPGPIEESEKPIYLDGETGRPIEISELLKRPEGRRHCIARVPEPRTHSRSYEEALARFQKDERLDPADRQHLKRSSAQASLSLQVPDCPLDNFDERRHRVWLRDPG
jgi:hypothetical protein